MIREFSVDRVFDLEAVFTVAHDLDLVVVGILHVEVVGIFRMFDRNIRILFCIWFCHQFRSMPDGKTFVYHVFCEDIDIVDDQGIVTLTFIVDAVAERIIIFNQFDLLIVIDCNIGCLFIFFRDFELVDL